LPRLIGFEPAKRMIFTGARINASQALAIGLIDELCTKERLEAQLSNWR
jgi:enoyl-CoA hydratase/carnithine racemase